MRTTCLGVLGLGVLVAACSSSSSQSPAVVGDAGTDANVAVDAGPDVPEPPWSGTTVEANCKINGCIRELTKKTSYDAVTLGAAAAAGNPVDNGVTVYFIRYWSDGREVTGSVFVPDSPAPAGGYPVVLMNQFTTGLGAQCAPSAGVLGLGVAGSTALRGFLTLVPDAPSYGGGTFGVFLAAKIAGRAALDGVRAAFHLGQGLALTVARKAVIAGFSQGGHSTMSAAAQLLGYAPHLEVRGFAAVAPPANFRSGINKVIQANKGSGLFIPMRMLTWQQFFAFPGEPVFKEPYRTQAATWFATECLFNANGKDGTLSSHFPDAPADIFSDTYIQYGKNDTWPAEWAAVYEESTPIPRGVALPIVIYQGDMDTTVPKVDTDAYVKELTDAGLAVDYQIVAGAIHGTTAFSSFTVQQGANEAAVKWIRDRLAP